MVYVITAVHNRYKITEGFVQKLKAQTCPDIRLVLVDDGSTDGTADMVLSILPESVILHGDGNLWWGGALHEAYKWIRDHAEDDGYVLIMNDDTAFDPTYIQRGVALLQAHPNTLVTGYGESIQSGEVIEGAREFDFALGKGKSNGPGYGNCASTRSLFFTVADMKKIGGFHPILLPHYGSDYEWCLRANRKYGYRVYCEESLKYYVNEESTGDNFYESMTRKKAFGKRSASNPVYRMSFILLSTPGRYLLPAVFAQLKRYADKRDLILKIMKK